MTDRPSFIAMRSIIAWPAPNAQNTEAAHGSALGDDEVAATKRVLGFDPEKTFEVADEVLAHTREALDRGREAHGRVGEAARRVAHRQPGARRGVRPDRRGRAARGLGGEAPGLRGGQGRRHPRRVRQGAPGARRGHPRAVGRLRRPRRLEQHHDRQDVVVPPGGQPAAGGATRTAARSTSASASTPWPREMNGIALHGNTRIYGGTFLVFSDYMRNAVRLSALMQLPVTYVWTHDSIGLGEDGPTHQPVEHLAVAARDPGPERRPPGRRQRDRDRLARDPQALHQGVRQGRPARSGADPPGRADVRGRTRTPPRAVTSCSRPRAARREVDPDRAPAPRCSSPSRRASSCRPTGVADPGGVDAVRRVVRGAGPGVPGQRPAAVREGPRRGRGRHRSDLAPLRRRRRPHRLAGALRRLRRRQGPLPRVRLHRRERRRRRPGIARRRRSADARTYDT